MDIYLGECTGKGEHDLMCDDICIGEIDDIDLTIVVEKQYAWECRQQFPAYDVITM